MLPASCGQWCISSRPCQVMSSPYTLVLVSYFLPLIFFFFFGYEACGILVPEPGIEPVSPAQSLNHWTTREVSMFLSFLTEKE